MSRSWYIILLSLFFSEFYQLLEILENHSRYEKIFTFEIPETKLANSLYRDVCKTQSNIYDADLYGKQTAKSS